MTLNFGNVHLRSGSTLVAAILCLYTGTAYAGEPKPCSALENTNATTECEWTVSKGSKVVSYWRNHSLTPANPNTSVTSLLVAIHGGGGGGYNAADYFDTMFTLTNPFVDPGLQASTAIVAPLFRDDNHCPTPATHLCWQGGGSGNERWLWPYGGVAYNEESVRGIQTSTFAILDEMLGYLTNPDGPFPNLNRIVIAGHSAGGQLTQRYAIFSTFVPRSGISIRYVPANPMSVAYFNSSLRPTDITRQTFTTVAGNTNSWNDNFVDFLPVNRLPNCAGGPATNDYPYGMGNISENYPYLADALATNDENEHGYLDRTVILLSGESDNQPTIDSDANGPICSHVVQGDNRQERMALYYNHLCTQFDCSRHSFIVVPGVAHNGRDMFTSPIGRRVIMSGLEARGLSHQHRVEARAGAWKPLGLTMLKTAVMPMETFIIRDYSTSGNSVMVPSGARGRIHVPVVARYLIDPAMPGAGVVESNEYGLRLEVDPLPFNILATLFGLQ